MENTPPNIQPDRSQWASLPTLSQLTTKYNKLALMDSSRTNQNSGLITPPNSQDATKMLISPPPEEVLRSAYGKGHYKQVGPPFTPGSFAPAARSNPANTSRPASVNSKRKRPGVVTSMESPAMDHITTTITSTTNTIHGHGEADAQPPEATPNPKPRKQSKRHVRTQSLDSPTRSMFPQLPQHKGAPAETPTKAKAGPKARSASPAKTKRVLIQSPHASNPNADFIPPVSLSASAAGGYLSVPGSGSARVLSRRSRSATPIPPYEPPKEVFTPPREVTISPPVQVSTRRSRGVSKEVDGGVGVGRVKKELPEIDWSLPMPPPSPGDDPLLLSGRPRRARVEVERSSSGQRTASSPTKARRILPVEQSDGEEEAGGEEQEEETMQIGEQHMMGMQGLMDISMDMDLPPSTDDFSEHDDGPAMPIFDLGAADNDAGWSDSDSEGEDNGRGTREGEGEYTGRFTMMTVRTKADPPTSVTRERMEVWGRPISPFPGAAAKRRRALPSVGELGARGEDDEMGELPVLEDDEHDDNEEEEDPQPDSKQVEVREGALEDDQEDHSLVEAARDAASEVENGAEEDDAAEESWHGGADEVGDYDMSVEFCGDKELGLGEEEPSYEQPESTSFEEREAADDGVTDMGAHLGELHDHIELRNSSAAPAPDEEEEEDGASGHGESFSFTRELSVEEEEEERSVDRELSHELEDGEEQEQEDDGGREVLSGIGEKSILNTTRTYQSRQARTSSSGRWDKPLRPSDFGQRSPGFARSLSQPLDVDHAAADESMVDVDDDAGSSEEGNSLEEGLVTITSNDPLAAARAAAILKLHDYDYLPKILLKQRRPSHATPEAASRNARRKSAVESGVNKHLIPSAAKKRRRRSTLGGMIGDRVFIPGSPSMSLPELLRHAEEGLGEREDVAHLTPVKNAVHRDPFKTPAPRSSAALIEAREEEDDTVREWTKDDWRQLDACFTDERLDVAEQRGLGSDKLADVDDIRVEDVVDRFVEMIGGIRVVDKWGSAWDRDSLLARTRALQKKQRSGNIAPPSPARRRSMSSRLSVVPDFTPITRLRPHPPALRPKLPPPLADSPFGGLPSKLPRVHGSLLAPRYSHLLEEAIAVSQGQPEAQLEADTSVSSVETEAADVRAESVVDADADHLDESFEYSMGVQQEDRAPAEQPSPGISKRVKGFFFSYLPTLSKSMPPQKSEKSRSKQPGLPLPPPEVLGKARGPISTPIRPPLPKPIHPKEQVHLQHAPSPKKSTLSRPSKPQRLVELHPTPPLSPTVPIPIQRNRRSSGGSVKDLVRSFEDMDNEVIKKPDIKRVRSIGDNGQRRKERPAWKP